MFITVYRLEEYESLRNEGDVFILMWKVGNKWKFQRGIQIIAELFGD